MTVYQSIHSAGVLEACVPGFTHSAVTRRFGVMQRVLGAWIEAERDLEHSGSWDPACDHWLRDAEEARAAVGAALDALCDTPAERLEDRPLLRIARLTRALALSEDGTEFAQLYARVATCGALLHCQGRHPLAMRVNLMLAEARRALAQLAALPDHAVVIDGACVDSAAPVAAEGLGLSDFHNAETAYPDRDLRGASLIAGDHVGITGSDLPVADTVIMTASASPLHAMQAAPGL